MGYKQVEHIIVLGHSSCGGIRALMDDAFEDNLAKGKMGMDFIPSWIKIGTAARERTKRYRVSKIMIVLIFR